MTALEEIEHLSDIAINVDVELDRKTMTVREILDSGSGQRHQDDALGGREHRHPGGWSDSWGPERS